MLHSMTPEAANRLKKGSAKGYIGFDPTAPSLTIGNYVQIMLLNFWQRSGNTPIVLMGGATGRIGDPSGKDKERQLKSYDELDKNLSHQVDQIKNLLDFDHPTTGAVLVNNYDFYKNMNVLDFLRDVGKTLTINYMSSKDSVKNRIETGLSFTEFSYQLLQAYDYQRLYSDYECEFQMGGSDQWGNITSGTEFIRKNVEGKAHAITTPLLTKSDGSKFGKSESGNIWLDPELTSPYQFYQFWINADDADLGKYLRYFSFKSQAEVEEMEKELAEDQRTLKTILAEEITTRIHGADNFGSVKAVSELLFNKKASKEYLKSLSKSDLDAVSKEINCVKIPTEKLSSNINIVDFLTKGTGILSSKGEVKRAIKNNAISINKEKVTGEDITIGKSDLLHDKYIMLENGKKNKYIVNLTA